MKPPRHTRPNGQRPHGHTLPELLVGLALGLAVIATALAVWQTARQAWLGFVAQQNLRHNARIAFERIAAQASLAGASALLGSTGDAIIPTSAYSDGSPDVRASDGGNKGSDTLSLGHWRSVDAADCQGNTGGGDALVLSQFQRSTTTVNDLSCKDVRASGSSFQAFAEGVEDLQVELAEASADGATLQWKSPQQVLQWSLVHAIAVCLRLVGTQRLQAATQTLTGCRGENVAADGRPRLVQRRVIVLRRSESTTP